MELETKIKKVYIESKKNQSGNALEKTWNAPFEFYIIAEFSRSADYHSEWDDYYSFICKVESNNPDAKIEFIGQNKRCQNPCRMRVLVNNSISRATFVCRVESPGTYIVDVNGMKTSFKVI